MVYIFKNSEVAEGPSSKNINRAEQKLAELNMEEGERRAYEKYLINAVRDRDALDTAKEEGREEGKVEGEIKGEIRGEIKKICRFMAFSAPPRHRVECETVGPVAAHSKFRGRGTSALRAFAPSRLRVGLLRETASRSAGLRGTMGGVPGRYEFRGEDGGA